MQWFENAERGSLSAPSSCFSVWGWMLEAEAVSALVSSTSCHGADRNHTRTCHGPHGGRGRELGSRGAPSLTPPVAKCAGPSVPGGVGSMKGTWVVVAMVWVRDSVGDSHLRFQSTHRASRQAGNTWSKSASWAHSSPHVAVCVSDLSLPRWPPVLGRTEERGWQRWAALRRRGSQSQGFSPLDQLGGKQVACTKLFLNLEALS